MAHQILVAGIIVTNYRWQWLPIAMVVVGIAIMLASAIAMRESLGIWLYVILAGGLVALVSLFWMRRELIPAESELDQLRTELEKAQQSFEGQLKQAKARIDKREQALAHKMVAFHEWTQLPNQVDLADYEVPNEQLPELVEKDRQLFELLEREAKAVFEKIRKNEYSVDGKLQPTRIRDDAYDLIVRVAKIYEPNAKQPVLETSIARVLQAASRACLHFVVVLDELPVNVKEYNLASMYGYIQRAVKIYGVYKSASPYFPYLNAAYYLGNVAFGAHPVTMGARWLFWTVGKRGGEALARRIVDRQALILLHDVIRVIGFEVASIYGGDFRHRDANWIYAVELTELVNRFPPSREALSHALKEIGALQLRNEYDRIYLFRLLSEQKSAQPTRFRAKEFLTGPERQAIAERLERFLATFVHNVPPKTVDQWREDVESRLQVKLKLAASSSELPAIKQTENALRSLASFLIAVKLCDGAALKSHLEYTESIRPLSETDRERLFKDLQDNSPGFFEQPNIDPKGAFVKDYFDDLVKLTVRTHPYEIDADDLVVDCAMFLRFDQEDAESMLDSEYQAYVKELLPTKHAPKQIPATVARAILPLIVEGGQTSFLYNGITIEEPRQTVQDRLWLLGTGDEMLLLAINEQPTLLWRADRHVIAEHSRGLLRGQCRLIGGEWLNSETGIEPRLIVSTIGLGNMESYFRPLLEFSSAAVVETATIDARLPAPQPPNDIQSDE